MNLQGFQLAAVKYKRKNKKKILLEDVRKDLVKSSLFRKIMVKFITDKQPLFKEEIRD